MHRSATLLAVSLAAALLNLSACEKDKPESPGQSDWAKQLSAQPSTEQGSAQVEVFSWWTGPGEQEGLDAMIAGFRQKYPGVDVINAAVSGGAGTAARAVLSNRLHANTPPDSYQRHAGLELVDDVRAGRVVDLTGFFEQLGWTAKMPKGLLDAILIDGKLYSVPVNIHRANLIWYKPTTLTELGLAGPPRTWKEFLSQAAEIKRKGKTALAVGPKWTQKHLLETVLLGELGPDKYNGLWKGSTDWRSPEVLSALETFTMVLSFSDVQSASPDWQPAADRVIDGTAVYTVMGDWLDGYWGRTKKLAYQVDYNVAASPGTFGVYDFLSDSFTLPVKAKHRNEAVKWLEHCGSTEGQDQFNPPKGSIPARIDADKSKYTGYLASALREWQDPKTKIVGSLAHGVVANNAYSALIDTALGSFVDNGDAPAFASAMAKGYADTK